MPPASLRFVCTPAPIRMSTSQRLTVSCLWMMSMRFPSRNQVGVRSGQNPFEALLTSRGGPAAVPGATDASINIVHALEVASRALLQSEHPDAIEARVVLLDLCEVLERYERPRLIPLMKLKSFGKLPAVIGVTGRSPQWWRKAKQSSASRPMRRRPSSAMSSTSPRVAEHRLASWVDLRLPPHLFDRIDVWRVAGQSLDAQPVALVSDPIQHTSAAMRG
jgi:hypothetical protein